MRRLMFLVIVAVIGLGGWWFWNDNPRALDAIAQYVENGEFLTLEARYTADAIMGQRRKELLVDDQHAFQEPLLKFYPYLLIEAKYVLQDKKTHEGLVLWGLTDGEMVLDTDTWETTHGFQDAMDVGASRSDFKIMHALAKNGGALTRDQLQRELHLESDVLAPWIDSVCEKKLVAPVGDALQLHLQNPKLLVAPQTKIKQTFVARPCNQAQRIARKYSRSQVEKIAQAAFGPSFTIRNVSEAFLPVYSIGVLNPDGSVHTSYWNAITGRQITSGRP